MRNLGLHYDLLFLFLLLQNLTTGIAGGTVNKNLPSSTSFIRAACKETLYPTLCVQCLSTYAHTIQQSERQLARAALAVSLSRARSAASFVSKFYRVGAGIKPREYQAVRDCIDNMGDSVDQLSQSLRELGKTNRQDFMWHMSNVQTWVSAALTDDNTCLDGFSGSSMNGKLKSAIRSRVVHVSQVTSNALALVNRFAERYHPGTATSTTTNSP